MSMHYLSFEAMFCFIIKCQESQGFCSRKKKDVENWLVLLPLHGSLQTNKNFRQKQPKI